MYKRSTDTMFCEVGSDIIALNVDRGRCYGMENVSATVWNLLTEPANLEQICDRLIQIYDVEPQACRSEIEQLMVNMQNEGLVEIVPTGSDAS
ncbi:MAG: PqqD family protein [Sphingomicrobium sp.]